MKASELRIGNIIEHPHKGAGGYVFVTHRIISDLASSDNPLGYRPIPLTEEWLERIGCESETEYSPDSDFELIYRDKNGQFRITKNKDGHWSYWPEELYGFSVDLGKEPALHTIQNIYFTLNSEELTSSSETNKSKAEQ